MLIVRFVVLVWVRHASTPVVRASGRELSYVLLAGILMCYLVTFALVFRPTDLLCTIQRSYRLHYMRSTLPHAACRTPRSLDVYSNQSLL